MDWYEFLERVTEGVPDNLTAASVRRELYLHLSFAAQDLQEQGYAVEEARRLALLRMGDPDELRDAFAPPQTELATLAGRPEGSAANGPPDVPAVIAWRYGLRVLCLIALGMAVLAMGGQGLAFTALAPNLLSLLPGLGLLWLAERYTPKPALPESGSWGKALSDLRLLWVVGGGCGLLSGTVPLWNAPITGSIAGFTYGAMPPLALLAAVAVVVWARRKCTGLQLVWKPFTVTGILMGSYAAASLPAVIVSERALRYWAVTPGPSANGWVQYYSQIFVPGFYSSMIQIAGIVLLATALAAEYGLPRRPGTSDGFRWPVLPDKPWVAFLSRHWRQLGCGCLVGLWSGLLLVERMTPDGSVIILLGFVIAFAAGLYGLGHPILMQRTGGRPHHPAAVATGLLLGFAVGAPISLRLSVYTAEVMVFAIFVYFVSFTAFRLFAKSEGAPHISA